MAGHVTYVCFRRANSSAPQVAISHGPFAHISPHAPCCFSPCCHAPPLRYSQHVAMYHGPFATSPHAPYCLSLAPLLRCRLYATFPQRLLSLAHRQLPASSHSARITHSGQLFNDGYKYAWLAAILTSILNFVFLTFVILLVENCMGESTQSHPTLQYSTFHPPIHPPHHPSPFCPFCHPLKCPCLASTQEWRIRLGTVRSMYQLCTTSAPPRRPRSATGRRPQPGRRPRGRVIAIPTAASPCAPATS